MSTSSQPEHTPGEWPHIPHTFLPEPPAAQAEDIPAPGSTAADLCNRWHIINADIADYLKAQPSPKAAKHAARRWISSIHQQIETFNRGGE